jgi:DNA polymerase III delta prime subunit
MTEFLWVEKYRPQTVADTILPQSLKRDLQAIVDSGEMPNMLFTGTAGLGKTTAAVAMCKQLGLDYIIINASQSGNIDTLRTTLQQFASTVSLQGGYKVIILDEADYLNAQSTQPALRGFIEEFSNNCRFILTCNFKNRIIEPLHSRCGVYEFNATKKELVELAGQFHKRLVYILEQEGITHDQKVAADLIMKHAPDWRRVLNECQRLSISGAINSVSSSDGSTSSHSDLVKHLKDKDFKKMRRWIVDNMDMDTTAIFRGLYDNMYDFVKPQSIPQLVLILADYQYKDAFVADHELNTVACMTEIMANVDFA